MLHLNNQIAEASPCHNMLDENYNYYLTPTDENAKCHIFLL